MKFILTIAIVSVFGVLFSQNPEITEEKRLMSLGEKNCFKVQIPYQTTSNVEKITTKYLKSQSAESVKVAKGSNEIVYKSLFLKDIKTPSLLYFILEQQGNNVGWKGFFINEKDSINQENTASIHNFMQNIYKLSMLSLYEDSITMQSKALKEAENKLKNLAKDAQKNDKNVNKSKREITDSEKEIEKSQENVKQTTAKIEELTSAIKEAESKLKTAESEMEKVNQLEITLKDLLKKDKEMNKRIKDLSKDPAANANLIQAQNQDLLLNTEMIKNQQQEFIAAEKTGKANLKIAEKGLDKAKDNLKNAEKTIKSENKNIQKAKDNIVDKNKEVDDAASEVNRFQTKEKAEAEEEIKKEKLKLDILKEAQNIYK
jgi:chromosome segregation ATPase